MESREYQTKTSVGLSADGVIGDNAMTGVASHCVMLGVLDVDAPSQNDQAPMQVNMAPSHDALTAAYVRGHDQECNKSTTSAHCQVVFLAACRTKSVLCSLSISPEPDRSRSTAHKVCDARHAYPSPRLRVFNMTLKKALVLFST